MKKRLPRTKNICELTVITELDKRGYEILKNGWPDFCAVRDDKIRFIEVKPKTKKLKPRQIKMKKVFKRLGLDYEVVYVDNDGTITKKRPEGGDKKIRPPKRKIRKGI